MRTGLHIMIINNKYAATFTAEKKVIVHLRGRKAWSSFINNGDDVWVRLDEDCSTPL